MKTRVSKKAVGVFVVSLLLLLLLVVMTSNDPTPLQSESASVCVLAPIGPTPVPIPVYAGEDMPMEELVESFEYSSKLPGPIAPVHVIGGSPLINTLSPGLGWNKIPNVSTNSPSPITGAHSPFTPAQPGGAAPSPIACAFGHEGDSVLSGNTTTNMSSQEVQTETGDDEEKRRYDAHKVHLYESWVSVKDDGHIVPDTVAALHTDELALQLETELDAELDRVQAIFRTTGSNHRPDEYRKLMDYLVSFVWLSEDARTLNKVQITIGSGNLLRLAEPRSDRNPDDAEREARRRAGIERLEREREGRK